MIPDSPVKGGEGRRFCGWGCSCAGLLGAILVFAAFSLLAGAIYTGSAVLGEAISGSLGHGSDQSWEDCTSQWKVVQIRITGAIMPDSGSGSFFSGRDDTVETILEDIRQAMDDEDVRGLLLLVDSPGGEINSCDLIYRELWKFRESDTNRCIVACMSGTAASGGYYVCLPANRILATPTTVTGSIGVMMNGLNYGEAARKLGINDMTFVSGPMKDMLNPMHGISPEVSNVVQAVIDELYGHFLKVIADSRKIPLGEVRKLADGRIYTASQAVANGLIDKVGYPDEAREAFEELGLTDYETVEYDSEGHFWDRLRSGLSYGGFWPGVRLPKRGFQLRYSSPFDNWER